MTTTQSIFLIGPMGVGKTTIGRFLAGELNRDFYDTDRVVEERTGADIPWIFDVEGEAGFRKREEAVCAELCNEPSLVIATGGGIIVNEANRRRIRRNGFVVYLSADVDRLVERTSKDTRRPLLQTANPREVIEQLLAVRDPLYREVADAVIDTESNSPKYISERIIEAFNERA